MGWLCDLDETWFRDWVIAVAHRIHELCCIGPDLRDAVIEHG